MRKLSRRAAMLRMRARGATFREIARAYGITTQRVSQIIGPSPRRLKPKKIKALKAPAWKPKEIAMLGTDLDREVAKRLGRTHHAVTLKRVELGIPPTDSRRKFWTAARVKLLGAGTDEAIAARLGCSRAAALQARIARGIPSYRDRKK